MLKFVVLFQGLLRLKKTDTALPFLQQLVNMTLCPAEQKGGIKSVSHLTGTPLTLSACREPERSYTCKIHVKHGELLQKAALTTDHAQVSFVKYCWCAKGSSAFNTMIKLWKPQVQSLKPRAVVLISGCMQVF